MNFIDDYYMGKRNENYVHSLIYKYWSDRQISKAVDEYSNYDFYDSKYKYELKSRRCAHDKYPTTIIPEMKCHKRTYLLFLDIAEQVVIELFQSARKVFLKSR